MSNSAFPIAIVELIIEDSYQALEIIIRKCRNSSSFQCHLATLLRVCKAWHTISERLMYYHVSLGIDFFVTYQDENGLAKRLGHEVAEQLLATMSTSSRIASLIKELRLAIRDVQRTEASECTWTSLRVLQLCPNVTHVEIRGFHHLQSDALAEALKAKSESLISLFITPHSLSTSNHHGSSFRILYVMHRLPKLRITNADGLPPFVERNAADAPDAPSCCPDLQEIQIVNCALHYNDLTSLRRMTRCVKNLVIVTKP